MPSKGFFQAAILLQLLFLVACSNTASPETPNTPENTRTPTRESSQTPEITSSPSPEPSKTPGITPYSFCGDNLISKEEEEGFLERYFEYLFFYDNGTGEHLEIDETGSYLLPGGHNLAIAYKTAFPNHLRICIYENDPTGNVVDESSRNTDGSGSIVRGTLEPGQYFVRAIVKNYIIDSFTLIVSD
jgi:hypothetical protein